MCSLICSASATSRLRAPRRIRSAHLLLALGQRRVRRRVLARNGDIASGLAHEQQHRLIRPASQAHRVERARSVARVVGPSGPATESKGQIGASQKPVGAQVARFGAGTAASARAASRASSRSPKRAAIENSSGQSRDGLSVPSTARRSACRTWRRSLTLSAAISSAVVAALASSGTSECSAAATTVRSGPDRERGGVALFDGELRADRRARSEHPRGTRMRDRALQQLRAGVKIAGVQGEPCRGDQGSAAGLTSSGAPPRDASRRRSWRAPYRRRRTEAPRAPAARAPRPRTESAPARPRDRGLDAAARMRRAASPDQVRTIPATSVSSKPAPPTRRDMPLRRRRYGTRAAPDLRLSRAHDRRRCRPSGGVFRLQHAQPC